MEMQTNFFEYSPESGKNPYMGFTTFQHFAGEELYSDIVVDPSRKMTETEAVEGYPVPSYVPQNGRNEGFYPDGKIAYIRIFWRDFEPSEGEFDYDFIENILKKADENSQTVMLRLMAHSTRASDDVPEWLKTKIECPERPEGKRVKDSPKDPEFLRFLGKAVRALGRFDGDERLYAVDISLSGAWGEGHQWELYPYDELLKLVDTYAECFSHTALIGQLSVPSLINYVSEKRPVGWRADGVGETSSLCRNYPLCVSQINTDLWKTSPVAFESYWWLGEWKRKGWNVDMIFETLLSWHVSAFNGKSIPIPNEWKEKIDDFEAKMGYHFELRSVSLPFEVAQGDEAPFEFCIFNRGVAPIYKKMPFGLRISGEETVILETDIDVRDFMPGTSYKKTMLKIPSDLPKGDYGVDLGICNGKNGVYFCTDALRDGYFYRVGNIKVK